MAITFTRDLSYSAEMGHMQAYVLVEVTYEHYGGSSKAHSAERYLVCDRFLAFRDRRIAVRSRNRQALWFNRSRAAREGTNEYCFCHARYGAKCNADRRTD